MQCWGNIDVVGFGARGLRLFDRAGGEFGQWGVCRVELEGTWNVNRNVDADVVVEIGLQPGIIVSLLPLLQRKSLVTYLYSLKCLRLNFSPLPGIFTQRLPLRQMELVPSISKRTQ